MKIKGCGMIDNDTNLHQRLKYVVNKVKTIQIKYGFESWLYLQETTF